MPAIIQSLESRIFLSVSAGQLSSDKTILIGDAALLKNQIAMIIGDSTTATQGIALDFKGLPKSDQTLLKLLITAENKARAAYLKDDGALVNPANSLANKAVALGDALLKDANVKTLAAESKDITALSSVTAVPLATLDGQLGGTVVDEARAAILSALADDSTIMSAVTAEQNRIDVDRASINTAAVQFQTDIGALASDLTTVHTQTGTFPATIGTYDGSALDITGKHHGQIATVTLIIDSEDANGNLNASVTDLTTGTSDPLVGTVSLNGVIALKPAPHTGSVKITGTFSDGTIAGHVSFPGAAGTFTVVEATG